MKPLKAFIIIYCFFSTPLFSQDNNTLRGKMLFLSSGKTPAKGVTVSGSIKEIENTNTVYTTDDGSYVLMFPKAREGHRVSLTIGEEDQHGKQIEVVNEKEVEICRISAEYREEFEIIVCPKGSRDLTAQKYYNIIKTSSDIALAKIKKEMDELLAQQEKDYNLIAEYGERIATLEQQTDSLAIYKEAFHIASINKDNASRRVLRYIQLLDEGQSILEAREVLSIKGAANDLDQSIDLFKAAIEELETRAGASSSIFDYEDAIMCYDTIISYSERMDIDPLRIAHYFGDLGEMFFENGNYEKALEYQKKSFNFQEEILDSIHPELAISYGNIGITYRFLGEYEKALENQQMSLKIQEEILDSIHPELAITLNNIGVTFKYLGEYEKALDYQHQALDIQEEILDSIHPDLATTYDDIGGTYTNLEQYEKALDFTQKALSISEKIYDPKHPQLAITYDNMGVMYRYSEQFKKALEFHMKAFDIREEVLNPKHPDLASSYENVGGTYLNLEQYEKALQNQLQALKIRKEVFDPNHPDLSWSYYNIGLTHLYLEQYELSTEYQLKALNIQEKILDSDHPLLAIRYHNLGTTFLYWETYEKALEYFEKALKIRKEVFGDNHPALAVQYGNIGLTYIKRNLFDDAYKAYKRYEELLPDHQYTYRNWTLFYAQQNKKEEAIMNLQKAIDLGFNDLKWLEKYESINNLKNEEEFKAIIESLKKE